MSAVQIVNLPQFMTKLEKLGQAAQGMAVRRALQAMGFQAEGYIKVQITSVGLVDTGNLRASIHPKLPVIEAKGGYVDVGTNVIYARIHEYGGIIRPVRAKVLAWQDKEGVWHHAKAVTIPARPYMRPAIDMHHAELAQAALGQLMVALQVEWAKG